MSQTYIISLREKYEILLHSIVLESLITYDIIWMIINFVCPRCCKLYIYILNLVYDTFEPIIQGSILCL